MSEVCIGSWIILEDVLNGLVGSKCVHGMALWLIICLLCAIKL